MLTMTTSASSTSAPPSVGSWVQYNTSVQSPLAALPTPAEQSVGIIRQIFTAQGEPYVQVVWNPSSEFPATGLYKAEQVCAITPQQAAQTQSEINAGTWQPPIQPGTPTTDVTQNYQQPPVPSGALPPNLQSVPVIPTLTGPTSQPLSPGVGYQ